MPVSIDVQLPTGVEPVFPDLCCACLRPRPGDLVALGGRRIRWAELFLPWLWFFGRRVRLHVPACADCRLRIVRARRWRLLLMLAAFGIAVPLVLLLSKHIGLPRRGYRWLQTLATVLAVAPLWLWMAFHPLAVDLTVAKDHVEYEFAQARYARAFLAANPRATTADRAAIAAADADADPSAAR